MAFTSAGRGIENHPHTFFTQELGPIKPPQNIEFKRSGTIITITWDPITLFEARGFPFYTVTLIPLSSVSSNGSAQPNYDEKTSIATTETDIVIEDLDPKIEYSLIITVETSSGKADSEEGTYTAAYCYTLIFWRQCPTNSMKQYLLSKQLLPKISVAKQNFTKS